MTPSVTVYVPVYVLWAPSVFDAVSETLTTLPLTPVIVIASALGRGVAGDERLVGLAGRGQAELVGVLVVAPVEVAVRGGHHLGGTGVRRGRGGRTAGGRLVAVVDVAVSVAASVVVASEVASVLASVVSSVVESGTPKPESEVVGTDVGVSCG